MQAKFRLTAALVFSAFLSLSAQNSLWINNPEYTWYWQSGNIKEASLTVHPAGLCLQYGLYLTFSADQTNFDLNDQLEVVMEFQLPEKAMVLDTWLWVGADIVQGRLIDRWSASDIYEGIVNRRRDPSVLYKNGDSRYQLRVYPIKKGETRKVKITYLVPVNLLNGKVEAGIPTGLLMSSAIDPDLFIFAWEENGFTNPVIQGSQFEFSPDYDDEFGSFLRTMIPAAELSKDPLLMLDSPSGNSVYLSTYEGEDANYYQLALSPGDYIDLSHQQKVVVLIDYVSANSSMAKSSLMAQLKQHMLNNFGEEDHFNLFFSRLRTEKAFDAWTTVTSQNLDLAIAKFMEGTTYSSLPGVLSEGIEFIKSSGGQGSIVLLTNTDNFANYEQANALIKDLKALQDPIPPISIADLQDLNYAWNYIGNRYYLGQEYLYVNLAKASSGYFQNIREEKSVSTLFSKVLSSLQGMITAFDLYTAPAEGFCYGRFTPGNLQGFPVTQSVTQIGKYFGETPFVIYLTGLYQSNPFYRLIQVSDDQIIIADSALSKIWHGRYIQELENAEQNNTVIQEILYESLANRILSDYTAFLCLEPSDSVPVCITCKDESRLVGIDLFAKNDSLQLVNLYPNPFTDKLNIDVDLSHFDGTDRVVLRIFNLTGQLVWEKEEAGSESRSLQLEWDGRGQNGTAVPAGQYIVMIKAGPAVWSKQVIKSQ